MEERFDSGGIAITPDAARHLVAKIANIPYYVQQLGFEVFRQADDAGSRHVGMDDVEAAFARLSGFNRDQYEQLMLTFSTAQKKLLIALSKESTREFDDAYRVRHALGVSSTVNSAKKRLLEDGIVENVSGTYTLADPFFAAYLRT